MKKGILVLTIMFLSVVMVACGGDEAASVDYDSLTREEQIKHDAEKVITKLQSTSISKISINKNLSYEDDAYIVLAYLSFNAKNRANTAKDMIELHNNEIGVKLAEISDVVEIAIFWEVPYLKEGDNIAKANLQRQGDNMYFDEKWFDGRIFN